MGERNLKWCDKCGEVVEELVKVSVSTSYEIGEGESYELCTICTTLFWEIVSPFRVYKDRPISIN